MHRAKYILPFINQFREFFQLVVYAHFSRFVSSYYAFWFPRPCCWIIEIAYLLTKYQFCSQLISPFPSNCFIVSLTGMSINIVRVLFGERKVYLPYNKIIDHSFVFWINMTRIDDDSRTAFGIALPAVSDEHLQEFQTFQNSLASIRAIPHLTIKFTGTLFRFLKAKLFLS